MELNKEDFQREIGKRIEHLMTVLPQLKKQMWNLYGVLGDDFYTKNKKYFNLSYDLTHVGRGDLKKTSLNLFSIEKAALKISMEMNERTFEMLDFKQSRKE